MRPASTVDRFVPSSPQFPPADSPAARKMHGGDALSPREPGSERPRGLYSSDRSAASTVPSLTPQTSLKDIMVRRGSTQLPLQENGRLAGAGPLDQGVVVVQPVPGIASKGMLCSFANNESPVDGSRTGTVLLPRETASAAILSARMSAPAPNHERGAARRVVRTYMLEEPEQHCQDGARTFLVGATRYIRVAQDHLGRCNATLPVSARVRAPVLRAVLSAHDTVPPSPPRSPRSAARRLWAVEEQESATLSATLARRQGSARARVRSVVVQA